jgi:hypothetical protein
VRKIYVTISFIVGLSLIFTFILLKKVTRSSEQVVGNQPEAIVNQPAPPEVRTEPEFAHSISDGFLLNTGVDSEGIYTMGDVEIEEGQRFLELCLLKRDVDGHLIDLCVDNIAMIALTTHSFACNSTLREPSSRLRFAIGGKGPSARVLHLGAKYQITGIRLTGESRRIKTSPLESAFTIPTDLPPHSVYKVELVVLDEQFNKRVAEEKEFERQQAVLENISVNLAKSFASDIASNRSYGAVYYQVETYKEKPVNSGKEAAFDEASKAIIPGPNKLGGELIIVNRMTGPNDSPFILSYAYIRELDKRNINIPEDADILLTKEDLIPISITFIATKVPEGERFKVLGFFEKKESKLFLLGVPFNPASIQTGDNRQEFDILIKPGSYFLKLYGRHNTSNWIDSLDLGTIEIKPDQQRYEIILPESTDWDKLNKM